MTEALEWGPDGQAVAGTSFDALHRTQGRVAQPVPQARVYNSANIAIPSGTATAITFNTELWDEGNCHSTSSNTSRLTAPVTGLYLITGQFLFDSTGGGDRSGSIRLNGTTDIALLGSIGFTYAAVISQRIVGSTQYRLTAGDYVELTASQGTGSAKNVVASGVASPTLMFVRLAGFTAQVFD